MAYGIPDYASNVRHVFPLDDLKPHVCEIKSGECWCRPAVEVEISGWTVVHNALDGREKFETGQRKHS